MKWWKQIHSWIESGDLILPMILVSVAHYVGVLAGRDIVFVAAAIGLLVDLGHYRLVKSALRYGGMGWWSAASVMTVIAFGYHFAFYSLAGAEIVEATLLAVPIPFLIIALAGLSVRGRFDRKFAEQNSELLANVSEPVRKQKANARRGDTKQRIIDEHKASPMLGVTELANLTGASKAFVSTTLKAERELGFPEPTHNST